MATLLLLQALYKAGVLVNTRQMSPDLLPSLSYTQGHFVAMAEHMKACALGTSVSWPCCDGHALARMHACRQVTILQHEAGHQDFLCALTKLGPHTPVCMTALSHPAVHTLACGLSLSPP